jgi:hypothetical protein
MPIKESDGPGTIGKNEPIIPRINNKTETIIIRTDT